MQTDRKALCSWSGGKDSCLALHMAWNDGLRPGLLLSMFEEDADRNRSHAVPLRLIKAQADAMGLALVTPRAGWPGYEATFIQTLKEAGQAGYGDAIFGDIDLVPHREWEEKVCAQAGLTPHLPLWEWPRHKVVEAVFSMGIRTTCVCVNTRFLPKEFCGRPYDRQFVADLPAGVDACGENGEFHTFVTWAPRFREEVVAHVTALRSYKGPPEYGGDEFWFAELT